MIRCPSCGSIHPENTLFCEECGSYMPRIGEYAADDRPVGQAVREPDLGHGEMAGLRTLVLVVGDGGRFDLPASEEVVLGRLDAGRAIFPDVDLTGEEGLERGISRRHARISQREGEIFLEDLNSLNGTFLNANRLVPELPYPVKNGDRIQLGTLVLTIYIK